MSVIIYIQSFSLLSKSIAVGKDKSKKRLIPNDQAASLIEKLQYLMTTQKPYLNTKFSLQSLSKEINITSHQMSQLLNDNIGKSFAEYTAELRITEAKALLKDPANDHLTIEAIAEMVGYMSKSTFNAAFKKYTGTTPKLYKIEG